MSTEAADAGKLRHAFAVDNCRQPDGTGHGWTGTRSDPDGVQAGQGPISLVVAGEGFEPSKAKPTDLQDEVQTVVTSDYGPRPPGQGTYRARSPPRVAAIPFAPSSPQRRRRGEVQVMYACSPVPPHTNVPMRSFRPRRLQVGEDFLYVFKPGA